MITSAVSFWDFLRQRRRGLSQPAFYILFGYVAALGTPAVGVSLGALHGLGRVVPLLFLVVLGGAWHQCFGETVRLSRSVKRWTGWAMVGLGAFILNYGIFGMAWFENSFIRQGWNKFLEKIAPKIAQIRSVKESSLNLPEGKGRNNTLAQLLAVIASIVVWNYWKNKNKTIINK